MLVLRKVTGSIVMRVCAVAIVAVVAIAVFAAPVGTAFAEGDVSAADGAAASSEGGALSVEGLVTGAYIVDAHPYYEHPVTGVMEDSGQNPGIGQGMTESVLGEKALLELYDDGSIYVTVRFSLMDNINDIKLSAQEDADSEYVPTDYMVMQESMGEGADAKADIRFRIPNPGAIVRAEFFVTAMGRDVVFFMDFSDPVPGSDDFIVTSVSAVAAPVEDVNDAADADTDAASAVTSDGAAGTAEGDAPSGGGRMDTGTFIIIAAVIIAAAVICGVILSRRKSKGDSR